MFMRAKTRKTTSGEEYIYYILRASWRDSVNVPVSDDLLNVGRHDDFDIHEMREVASIVTARANGEPESVFHEQEHSEKVRMMADSVYSQLIALGRIDLPNSRRPGESELEARRREHERRFIADTSTMEHKWSLQIGAEHLCVETLRKLRMGEALMREGFSREQTALALTQIAARAVHPASELATAEWIRKRSDICRLTGYDVSRVTKDKLYASSVRLFDVRKGLMGHLSRWTKELFNYDDSIILYDLTNTYAEGQYDNSKWWDYGNSKKKRRDCKLLVLALVVNRHGFPKHYQLFEGRMQDTDSLRRIIDELDRRLKELGVKPVIVMDAGIATADNLDLIRGKGYKFLCVSRSSQKAYKPMEGEPVQHLEDKLHQPIEIQRVEVESRPDKDGKLPAAAKDTVVGALRGEGGEGERDVRAVRPPLRGRAGEDCRLACEEARHEEDGQGAHPHRPCQAEIPQRDLALRHRADRGQGAGHRHRRHVEAEGGLRPQRDRGRVLPAGEPRRRGRGGQQERRPHGMEDL